MIDQSESKINRTKERDREKGERLRCIYFSIEVPEIQTKGERVLKKRHRRISQK